MQGLSVLYLCVVCFCVSVYVSMCLCVSVFLYVFVCVSVFLYVCLCVYVGVCIHDYRCL